MPLKLLTGAAIILLFFISLIASYSYNPYYFKEYRISRIDLDGTVLSPDSDRRSVSVNHVSVSAHVYTSEWETWETEKLGGPYRISFSFEQGCQDPAKWYSEVEITGLHLLQGNEKTELKGFPQRLVFTERPTVPGTPRQNGSGLMMDEKFDLIFEKNVILELKFQIPPSGNEHLALFEFEPYIRKGLFRAID